MAAPAIAGAAGSAPKFDAAQIGQGINSLFGAAASVLGANASIRAADKQQDYLNQSADYDLLRGRLAQADVDRQAKAVLDGQKASYAAQGVDLASESVSQVREETFYEAQRVKNEVELNAAMEAWGKREQGAIGRDAAADNARAARIAATGQVIGGVSQIIGGGMK
jgi:hypothetical protein